MCFATASPMPEPAPVMIATGFDIVTVSQG
jgi:hypothetical protein